MAQTITAATAVRDSSATVTAYAAQDTNYVAFDQPDENIVIIVTNSNDAVAVETATITIAPGSAGFAWRKDIGTLTVEIADANAKKVIGPLDSARFKGTTGNVTIGVSVTQGGTASSVKFDVIKLP